MIKEETLKEEIQKLEWAMEYHDKEIKKAKIKIEAMQNELNKLMKR